MMKNDKQMLDMLRNELEKSSESVKIPLKLQKESMVAMLKNDKHNETDFSVKTGTNKPNTFALRNLAAVAAMLALVIVGILAMRADGIKVIRKDTFYSGYEGAEIVRSAQSYEEVESAVKEILGEGKTEGQSKPQGEKNPVQTGVSQTVTNGTKNESFDKLYEGYQYIVAVEKQTGSEIGENALYTASADVVSVQNSVDADIVKRDGDYLYIVTTGKNSETGSMTEQIKIVKSVPAEEMHGVSTVTLSVNEIAGAFRECIEIYVKDNILIAILAKKDFETEGETTAIFFDVSNPEFPVKIREHTQNGKYLFSSMNGNGFCLVTDKQITANKLVPEFDVNGTKTSLSAEEIFISVKDPEASYIFITVTDISAFEKPVGRLAILGSGKQLYCSESAITATREFASVEPDENGLYPSFTELYRFNISGASVSLAGSYVVEGSVSGGVSVNGETGYLTVVTVLSDSCNLCIFDENMGFVSGLVKIFPHKNIDDIRFIGENGYLSSGDETLIVDLSSAKSPKVAGTIQSKVFTGSLYEISESELLEINMNSDSTVKFRLFDVSNPGNPTVASEYTLESDCYTLSSLDVRSIMIVEQEGIFAIPVVMNDKEKGTEISAYAVFDVSDGEIALAGICRHDESYVSDAAVRAAYNNSAIYTVSGKKIVAFSIGSFEKISDCKIR
ncbi:MAG: beta-propeller domain-containing protein [Clostridia bacterium]|nr:beta-propeller domain-containing protein [Clostridia bacterium]